MKWNGNDWRNKTEIRSIDFMPRNETSVEYVTVKPGCRCLVDSGNELDPYRLTVLYPRLIDNYFDPFLYDVYVYDKGDAIVCEPLDFN